MKFLGEYQYIHNGEEIMARLSADESEHNISFSYRKIEVNMFWFDSKKVRTYGIIEYLCNIIDRISSQKDFDEFRKYYNKINEIKNNYIIFNDKVYYPEIIDKTKAMINPCIAMYIEFQNDEKMDEIKLIDGINFNKYKEQYNFIEKIKGGIRYKGLIPKDKYINQKKTEEYKKYMEWFNNKNLYFYPND